MLSYWIILNKCSEKSLKEKGIVGKQCKKEAEIDEVLKNSYLIMNIMSEYYDEEEIDENPIKR